MHGITKLALIVTLPIVMICGCEKQPEPVPKVEPAPKAPPPSTPKLPEASPSNTDALPGVGPSGAEGRADRRQAVIDLLTDGRSAEPLSLAATAPGEKFDPGLAEKLAPKVWVSDRPRSNFVPQIKQGKLAVKGHLDKDIIRRIVRAHINELRYCYNGGLSRNPRLAGRVSVDFQILDSGKVASSSIGSTTTLPDEAVVNCIAKAIARWTFPKPEGGGVVDVSYPFDLSPD